MDLQDLLQDLLHVGYTNVRIAYYGSSDEGSIGEITAEVGDVEAVIPDDLTNQLENWAYEVLESHHPGWEINEGSEGDITIDVVAGKAVLSHGENIIQQHVTTLS
jgi:hypothetical protein